MYPGSPIGDDAEAGLFVKEDLRRRVELPELDFFYSHATPPEWLEARLRKYPHTALIISHDRELLNNSCTHILHISEQQLTLYTGGYDDFERMRAEKWKRLPAASVGLR